jgi:hypothetical protein
MDLPFFRIKKTNKKICPVFPTIPKHFFCPVLFWTISFAKAEGLVTYLLYDL